MFLEVKVIHVYNFFGIEFFSFIISQNKKKSIDRLYLSIDHNIRNVTIIHYTF